MYSEFLKTRFHDAWKLISYPHDIFDLGLMEECAQRALLVFGNKQYVSETNVLCQCQASPVMCGVTSNVLK